MPNGGDRNFIRLCAAIDGFFVRYGVWPTRVRLSSVALADLRDHVLGPAAFATVERKLRLVADKVGIVAEDDAGRSYNYGNEGFPETLPEIDAQQWLGVEPLPSCYDREPCSEQNAAAGTGPALCVSVYLAERSGERPSEAGRSCPSLCDQPGASP
jgi:hypothetical protein